VGGVIGPSLLATTLVMGFSVAFAGKFSPNFDLKNVISVAYMKRIFDGKKKTQIHQNLKTLFIFSNRQIFMISSSR
jgi:hypothetical protein